jgi:prepilin-type N-terminal cleavage/methylation domain-containing protein
MVRRARGLTMIEVLIALAVATVALLGTLGLVLSLMNGSSFTRAATEASTLAQSKIEAANSLPGLTVFGTLVPPNGTTTEYNLDFRGQSGASGPYTRATTWSLTADNQRRRCVVQVSWSDSRSAQVHSVTAAIERVP